jgi:hypothetical protein
MLCLYLSRHSHKLLVFTVYDHLASSTDLSAQYSGVCVSSYIELSPVSLCMLSIVMYQCHFDYINYVPLFIKLSESKYMTLMMIPCRSKRAYKHTVLTIVKQKIVGYILYLIIARPTRYEEI